MYKLVNVNLNIAFHSTAVFHTLCISLFRLLAVKFPHFSRRLLHTRNSQIVSLTLHLVTPLLCIPAFFSVRVSLIEGAAAHRNPGCGCHLAACYDLVYAEGSPILPLTLWIYGIVFKLIPCMTISFSSFILISSLETIQFLVDKNRSRHLLTSRKFLQKRYKRRRLTKMLVIISLTCAVVETPHATLHLLTGIVGAQFGRQVYDHMGDFFEMLTLLYSSINFVMYCMMNEEFRRAVKGQVSCPPSVRHLNGNMSGAENDQQKLNKNELTKNKEENKNNSCYNNEIDETELVSNTKVPLAPCSKSNVSDQS
uniref:G-protein coupled receptors family 1 profile domain-containing protein n=1 Tax=Romanomermis culicivorax TaxID=13658 RepID=A0A915HM52_ROMCU